MDENIKQIYDKAISMYKEANYRVAIKYFTEVIDIDEANYNAFMGVGFVIVVLVNIALPRATLRRL